MPYQRANAALQTLRTRLSPKSACSVVNANRELNAAVISFQIVRYEQREQAHAIISTILRPAAMHSRYTSGISYLHNSLLTGRCIGMSYLHNSVLAG